MKLSKSIFKSKTFWLNLLALLNELIKVLPINESIQNVTIPTSVVALALPPANIILRKFTSKETFVIPPSPTLLAPEIEHTALPSEKTRRRND